MAKGLNKVMLIGHVGGDPEVRHMPNGNAVATISLATTEVWKDKQTGEKQERTEWHRVVCFNRLGEIVGEYVRKGSRLYLEGSLRTRKWQDPQGQDRYTTEIVAAELQMLDGKSMGNFPQESAASPAYSGQSSREKPVQQSSMAQQEAFTDLDDDIPF